MLLTKKDSERFSIDRFCPFNSDENICSKGNFECTFERSLAVVLLNGSDEPCSITFQKFWLFQNIFKLIMKRNGRIESYCER